ncbi:MAG: patatin-like phospholipase family protein [Holosporaceae bacterium]|nr:patatin-like phospholipase family protein [Holosporaceae bacterium]
MSYPISSKVIVALLCLSHSFCGYSMLNEEEHENSEQYNNTVSKIEKISIHKPNKSNFSFSSFTAGSGRSDGGATKLVLSLDGGGTRGLIEAIILREIVRQLPDFKPDLVVGTSVGALVGTAFALGKINEFVEDFGPIAEQMFTRNWSWWNPLNWFRSTRGISGPLYQSEPKQRAIEDFLGAGKSEGDFSYETLGTRLMFPLYSARNGRVAYYRNYDESGAYGLVDALMSTTAAPSYFNPHTFRGLDKNLYEGIDGGVFANNPSKLAHDEMKVISQRERESSGNRTKIVMLSMGTGRAEHGSEVGYYNNRGMLFWAQKMPNIFMDSASQHSHVIASHGGQDYYRVDPVLAPALYQTDNTSKKHLDALTTVAMSVISDRSDSRYHSFIHTMKAKWRIEDEAENEMEDDL